MYSPLCQSYFAYLHILRYPRGDLTKLNEVGLADGRNIEIITDDGNYVYNNQDKKLTIKILNT